ncbi:MAG: DUF4347 domain-containing protein [Cyanobacteria bacterium J06597_16]
MSTAILNSAVPGQLGDIANQSVSVRSPIAQSSASALGIPAGNTGEPIVFIDSAVDNLDQLIASITQATAEATVYLIEGQDGVEFISDVLWQHQAAGHTASSLHIFGHGQAGQLQLGTTTLTADSLNGYAEDLAAWGLTQTNDVLLYGCEVAKGHTGNAFIDQLAVLTGADILASDDLTGSTALGGDWDLEVATGTIETALVISERGQASYQGTLALTIGSATPGQTKTIRINEGRNRVRDFRVRGAGGGYREGNGVEYYFGGGQDAYLFDLDTDTGVLSFKTAADYENPADANRDNIYDVNILAIDYTGQSVNQAFGIKIRNLTDNDPTPPQILEIASNGGGSSATIAVAEGTSLVTDINVTGARGGFTEGNGVEYYFFGGQDAYLFDLNNDTGLLSFKDAPEFDNPIDANGDNTYDVRILAIDYAGQETTQTMAIEVQEVAAQAPVITSNGGNDTAVINVNEGNTAVTDVNASAANSASEGNGFVYSLNDGEDAGLFDINPTTGVISFKTAPDFENPGDADSNNVYFANVLVQDPTGAADSQFLSVVVKNVVEANNKPVITSNGGGDAAFVQVPENTLVAVDMSATDAEGDTEGNGITYQINAGEDADRFNIDLNTGVISFKVSPDFENPLDDDGNNIYRINVLAFDSQGQADSQFIEIEVTNMVSVYLLGGQSNMAGETSNANDLAGTPLASPLPAVQIWQPGFNAFEELRPGFDSNFGTGSGFGAELGFGHAMEAARVNGSLESEEIYIVKYAIGATSLAVDWKVNGGSTYSSFNAWVGGALDNLEAAGIGFEIEAMLWMQGENDAFTPSGLPAGSFAANYQANLTNFISDIRNRYNTNLDFVIGRLHDELTPNFYTDAEVVRSAQTNVANANSKNYLVNTDSFRVNPVDGVHFDSSGHLALGEAFAAALIG